MLKKISLLVLLLITNLCGIILFVDVNYLSVDLAEMVYHAKEINIGRIPYSQIATHHFLGYVVPLAIIDRLFTLTPSTIWATIYCYNLANAALLFLITNAIAGPRCGYLAALLTASFGWFSGWVGVSFNLQSQLLPILNLLLLMVILGSKHKDGLRFRISGNLIFGALLCFDQRILPFTALLFIPYIGRGLSYSRIAAELLATAFFPLVALGYLWYHGVFHQFYSDTIIYPILYRNAGVTESNITGLFGIIVKGISLQLFQVGLAFTGLILLLSYEKWRNIKVTMVVYLLAALIYIALGGRGYTHYFMILAPPIILLCALIPHLTSIRFGRAEPYFSILTAIALLVGLSPLLNFIRTERFSLDGSIINKVPTEVGEYIKSDAEPNTSILVWGYSPQIYLTAERFSEFSSIDLIAVVGSDFETAQQQSVNPEAVVEFKRYLETKAPHFFVYYQTKEAANNSAYKIYPQRNFDLNNPSLGYMREWLDNNYTKVEFFSTELDQATVYKLR